MVTGEIELEETELLLLQHLLGGDNFGAGYDDFRNKNINAAQFKANHRGDLYRTTVVERAQEGGRLSELRFRIEVPSIRDDDPDREINVVANREGFFRSRQKGPHTLLDQFIGNLAIVKEYRDKLTPLDNLLEEYIEQKTLSIGQSRKNQLMTINRAFKKLIDDHLNGLEYESEEIEIYKAIVANTGIALSNLSLRDEQYPDIGDFDGETLDYRGCISEFFEVYAVHVNGMARPDFDLLAGHLYYILNREDEYNTPTELLEYIESTYDI